MSLYTLLVFHFTTDYFSLEETTYTFKGVISRDTNIEVRIVLHPSRYFNTYNYLVGCGTVEGGCPKTWPARFKVVEANGKYVIIPLEDQHIDVGGTPG